MASFNHVTLLGNLTRDVDLHKTAAGKSIAKFGIAVNDRYKAGNGEWVDKTMFIDVVIFGGQADVAAEFLQKGSPVLVSGKLELDQWDDKATGQKRSKHVVMADKMQMLGHRGDATSQERPPAKREESQAPAKEEEVDAPW